MHAKRSALTNCLHTAAIRFDEIAAAMATTPGHERMAQMFKDQASEARSLAAEIEQADTVRLED